MSEPSTTAVAPAPTPNVLVFLCDQLRLDLLGCYGGRLVRTLHLDALAADGVVFDRAYTPTAICSPARTRRGWCPRRSGFATTRGPSPSGPTAATGWRASRSTSGSCS